MQFKKRTTGIRRQHRAVVQTDEQLKSIISNRFSKQFAEHGDVPLIQFVLAVKSELGLDLREAREVVNDYRQRHNLRSRASRGREFGAVLLFLLAETIVIALLLHGRYRMGEMIHVVALVLIAAYFVRLRSR